MSGPAASGCWQRWTGRSDRLAIVAMGCSRLVPVHAWRHRNGNPAEPSMMDIIELF